MLNASQKTKSTPAGDMPVDWECAKLCTLADFRMGFAFKSSDFVKRGVQIVKMGNLYERKLQLHRSPTFVSKSIYESSEPFQLHSGDLVMSLTGTVGKEDYGFVVKLPTNIPPLLLNQRVTKIISKPAISDSSFLLFTLSSSRTRKQIYSLPSGTKQANLSASELRGLNIPIPPLPEQKKIAEILGTWDRAIETQQQLIDSLTRRKKALMQQLLTGKTRLPGFEDEWKEVSLSALFSRVSTKNKEGHTQVVTISAQQGLICQQDYFNKQIASKLLDNYFVLEKGQFAYNKSYSKGYPMGAIKRLNRYDHGVVTTLYICFEIKSEDHSHSDFWEHYFESGALNRGLTRIAHEGGRAHGLLNVTPKDFFELKIQAPSIKEQKAIAQVLTTTDREITHHTQHLESLRTQKRGLMQQLLTGKTRVTL